MSIMYDMSYVNTDHSSWRCVYLTASHTTPKRLNIVKTQFTSLLVEDKFSGALAKENNNNNNKKTKRLRKERLRLPSTITLPYRCDSYPCFTYGETKAQRLKWPAQHHNHWLWVLNTGLFDSKSNALKQKSIYFK